MRDVRSRLVERERRIDLVLDTLRKCAAAREQERHAVPAGVVRSTRGRVGNGGRVDTAAGSTRRGA
jgi:hypothetical protein